MQSKSANTPAVGTSLEGSRTANGGAGSGVTNDGQGQRRASAVQRDIDDFMGTSMADREGGSGSGSSGAGDGARVGASSSGWNGGGWGEEDGGSAVSGRRVELTDNSKSAGAKRVRHQGWLLKKGQGKGMMSRRNWKRRWFTLDVSHCFVRTNMALFSCYFFLSVPSPDQPPHVPISLTGQQTALLC